jgi:hypothetical protein
LSLLSKSRLLSSLFNKGMIAMSSASGLQIKLAEITRNLNPFPLMMRSIRMDAEVTF